MYRLIGSNRPINISLHEMIERHNFPDRTHLEIFTHIKRNFRSYPEVPINQIRRKLNEVLLPLYPNGGDLQPLLTYLGEMIPTTFVLDNKNNITIKVIEDHRILTNYSTFVEYLSALDLYNDLNKRGIERIAKCPNCEAIYFQHRTDQKYCSDRCRKYAHRTKDNC